MSAAAKLFADVKTDAGYRAWKALIAAQYCGVDIEVPSFDYPKDAQTEEFKKKSCIASVPLLETAQGFTLCGSDSIARYVARLNPTVNLMGDNFAQNQKVEQWVEWCSSQLEPARNTWMLPVLGALEFDANAYKQAVKDVKACLEVLNNLLLSHTFIVGNHVTLADICLVASLANMFSTVFAPDFLKSYTNVVRWFETCVNQPQFAKVIGKVEFAKEEKKAAVGKGGKKEKKAEKGEKKEKAEKPKAEKPKEKPAENKSEVDGEEKAVKKAPNPLDLLPPSETGMNLDTTKRTFYSQKPFNPEFYSWFWKQYDAKGFSWWVSEYKYNDENNVLFMTSNLVNGFIQRCEETRKYAWGVLNILGKNEDEGPFSLSGAWLFRGVDIPKEMKDVPDSDGYTWTKVDVSTEEGRKLIEAQFTANTLKGLEVLDRKGMK